MNMTSSLSYSQLVWRPVLSLVALMLCCECATSQGQEQPTKIESELPLTIERDQAGKLYLFDATAAEYIVDVTFYCSFSWEMTVYDPFGEDLLYPAWRTAVFQDGQFIGYLKQSVKRREFQRRPIKLKNEFVVGAAYAIEPGPRTLLETTAHGPNIEVLGYGKYELQTLLLQNFLAEKPRENAKVIARSAAFPIEVTQFPHEPAIAAHPEGRAEAHIVEFPRAKVKHNLFFYYVNTTKNTREIFNPFVQVDYGPEVAWAPIEEDGRSIDYLYFMQEWRRDRGPNPELWVDLPTQGIVGRVNFTKYEMRSGKEISIIFRECYFAPNFFKTMGRRDVDTKWREVATKMGSMSNLKVLESAPVVVP